MEKDVISTNGAKIMDIHMQNTESRHGPYNFHKN